MSFLKINNPDGTSGIKRPFRLSDIQDIWNGIKSLFKAISGQSFRIISGFDLENGVYTSGTVWYNGELYEYDKSAYPITSDTARVAFARVSSQDDRVWEDGDTLPFSYRYVCGGDTLSGGDGFTYFVENIEKYKSYLGDGSVTTAKLGDGSVTTEKLEDDCVNAVKSNWEIKSAFPATISKNTNITSSTGLRDMNLTDYLFKSGGIIRTYQVDVTKNDTVTSALTLRITLASGIPRVSRAVLLINNRTVSPLTVKFRYPSDDPVGEFSSGVVLNANSSYAFEFVAYQGWNKFVPTGITLPLFDDNPAV